MIHPEQVADMLKKTSSLLVPTSTGSPSVDPVPTVVPDHPIHQNAGEAGARTLWVVFVLMLLATITFSGLSWTVPTSRRLYHVVTTLITIIASLSYFAMATGHGVSEHHTRVRESHKHVPDTYHDVYRQVFWARYVDWALTTPLLLLDLCLLAGVDGAHTLMAIVADEIMILTGLFAAFGNEGTPQKWGWYTIACIAYLVVIWHLAIHGRAKAFSRGDKVSKLFGSLALFTLILWTAYPIVWGVADGSRRASVNDEIIAYAVLDLLAKPVFGLWLLLSHARLSDTHLELGGYWTHGLTSEGAIRIGDDDEGA
ncbi:family a g protein-coupled receptor-like protein [Diplodia corticola]|uniref:Family a g protein-coupled receptor-like protein n=1 Tax=Diplodia corticola TaxID=236234 RepID=A0A1J9R5W4_9PEZI|nr:family a g protein-coupled receptor-like protein [Diplodia corticola]OJD36910.1 family a g protein-coupled receptor-like protein [Diplodia corticola]